ncbi:MAG: hypothetical protein MK213_09895, partial [Planctomycetes bacterium]|nr:hypothetical protein [Planctomycetota bacterium]
LVRAEDGAEVLEVGGQSGAGGSVAERIRQGLSAAREATHEFPQFRVIESTNLRVFLENNWKEYTRQPGTCHMQALRQVVSPLGTFNCPAHRGVEKARLGGRAAWMPSSSGAPAAAEGTARLLDTFDAARECAEVTCLYNPVNHFLEDVVSGKQALPSVTEIEKDFFL